MNLLSVLHRPLVTEKSTAGKETRNEVAFEVDPRASKGTIRAAVEEIFKVKVTAVRTLVVRGKTRRFGRTFGRRPSWKKAYVRLKPGDKIEFFEGV